QILAESHPPNRGTGCMVLGFFLPSINIYKLISSYFLEIVIAPFCPTRAIFADKILNNHGLAFVEIFSYKFFEIHPQVPFNSFNFTSYLFKYTNTNIKKIFLQL